jgi:hypothetical protein
MVRVVAWVETLMAGVTGALFLATVLWPTWIEMVLGVEPDGGDGTLEVGLTAALSLTTVVFSVLARRTWRRLLPAS